MLKELEVQYNNLILKHLMSELSNMKLFFPVWQRSLDATSIYKFLSLLLVIFIQV